MSDMKELKNTLIIHFLEPHPYLVLDTAGVVDNTHTGGVGSNIQPPDDLSQEYFNLLEL